MSAPGALTAAQRREKVRLRFGTFAALARSLNLSPAGVVQSIDQGQTTSLRLQRCLAGIGVPMRLVQPGHALRDKPFCGTARAERAFQQQRARR